MLCPGCEVWELAASDNFCSWCRFQFHPYEAVATQTGLDSAQSAQQMQPAPAVTAAGVPSPVVVPSPQQPGPLATKDPSPGGQPPADASSYPPLWVAAARESMLPRTPGSPRSFTAAPATPPLPTGFPALPSQPQPTSSPVSAPQQPYPATAPPYQPVVPLPTRGKAPRRSILSRIAHFIGAAALLVSIVGAALVLGVVLLIRSLFAPAPPKPPTIAARPLVIRRGQSSQLEWSAEGLSRVQLNGQPVRPKANRAVAPPTTTSYEITAESPTGKIESAEVQVIVIQPPHVLRKPNAPRRPPPLRPTPSRPRSTF